MRFVLIMALLLICSVSDHLTAQKQAIKKIDAEKLWHYPESKTVDVVDTYFDTKVADPYRWLEDENSEETKEWVEAQNELTEAYLISSPLRKKIKNYLTEVWNYPRYGTPKKRGEFYYFKYNDGLQNQSILYRSKNASGEEKEAFLDPNTFSDDGTASLSWYSFSKDARYMAYSVSNSGSDWREVFVMDTQTGEQLNDHLTDIKFSGMEWYKDGFYYSRYEGIAEKDRLSKRNENRKVYYHKVGTEQSEDVLIHEDPEGSLKSSYVFLSEDEQYFFLVQSTGTDNKNTLYFKSSDNLERSFTAIEDSLLHDVYLVDHIDGKFLVKTNFEAPNYKLVWVDPANPAREHWQDVVGEKEDYLEGAYLADGKLLLVYLKDVTSRIHIYNINGNLLKEAELPGLGNVSGIQSKWSQAEVFLRFSSIVYPSLVFNLDLKTGKCEALRSTTIQFKPENFVTRQVFYESKDGTKVPMFITHKKGLELNGNQPTLLYGYGGFSVSVKPSFRTARTVFLENGGVYAQANLRGGNEYGEEWHKAGQREKKQNVFDDFIAAAEYLIDSGYTNSKKLAISGRSNGGLLVGAVMTQRPDLFRVALPAVGVLDMLRYHKFTIGWAWVDEYGSSDDENQFEYLLNYSPLHNIKEGEKYPATLITTADHDDRVVPAHSYKFAATLQKKNAGALPILIRIDTKAGHGSGKSTAQYIDESTDIWTFVFTNLGMTIK